MSNAAWRIRKAVAALSEPYRKGGYLDDQHFTGAVLFSVLQIIDEEIERDAEQQFTRPISKQAEMSQLLKEDK